MCGRYCLTDSELRRLVGLQHLRWRQGAAPHDLGRPRYNIAPTQTVPAIRHAADGDEVVLLRWGFIPPWSPDSKPKVAPINAKMEGLLESRMFRPAFERRRCLVVADGFYEWKKVGSARQPVRFTRPDGALFALGGIWSRWQQGDAPAIESVAIVTTVPNAVVAPIHDRMPAIVPERGYRQWLDATADPREAWELVSTPAPDDYLLATPVSAAVNKVANDTPECIQPAVT